VSGLHVAGLDVRLGELHILQAVDLDVPAGELHVLMGPNGSGKSTLCHALMGRPGYLVSGVAEVDGVDLLGHDVAGRAGLGLFEVFQYPVEIPGVTLAELLSEMAAAGGPEVAERSAEAVRRLDTAAFLDRSVNVGLSGGEKKRSEMTQLMALAPRVAVLDELDSGLDVDAVREVAAAVEAMRHPGLGILVITHYTRLLRHLAVDRVHVLVGGRLVASGDRTLADRVDHEGYDSFRVGSPGPVGEDPFLSGL
jgi:Fe-S cluster assembly ATP-binding protein